MEETRYKYIRDYKDLYKRVKKMYKFIDSKLGNMRALFKSADNKYNMVYLPTGENKMYKHGKRFENDAVKREDYKQKSLQHERGVMFVPKGIANEIKSILPNVLQKEKNSKYLKGKDSYQSIEGDENRVMIPVRVSADDDKNKILLKRINTLYQKIRTKLIENINTSIKEYTDLLNNKEILPDEGTDEFNNKSTSVRRLIGEIKEMINSIVNKISNLADNLPDDVQINATRTEHPRQTGIETGLREEKKEEEKRKRGRPKISEEVKKANIREANRREQEKLRRKRGQQIGKKGRPRKELKINYNEL